MKDGVARSILKEKNITAKWYNKKTIDVSGHNKLKEIYIDKNGSMSAKIRNHKGSLEIIIVPNEPVFNDDFKENKENIVLEVFERLSYNFL